MLRYRNRRPQYSPEKCTTKAARAGVLSTPGSVDRLERDSTTSHPEPGGVDKEGGAGGEGSVASHWDSNKPRVRVSSSTTSSGEGSEDCDDFGSAPSAPSWVGLCGGSSSLSSAPWAVFSVEQSGGTVFRVDGDEVLPISSASRGRPFPATRFLVPRVVGSTLHQELQMALTSLAGSGQRRSSDSSPHQSTTA